MYMIFHKKKKLSRDIILLNSRTNYACILVACCSVYTLNSPQNPQYYLPFRNECPHNFKHTPNKNTI